MVQVVPSQPTDQSSNAHEQTPVTQFLDGDIERAEKNSEKCDCERKVDMTIRVIQIGKIDLPGQTFQCRFDLFAEWVDEDASKEFDLHYLIEHGDNVQTDWWEPRLRFVNADSFTIVEKIYLKPSKEHRICFRLTVEGEFRVKFDLTDFPFDLQALRIQIMMGRDRHEQELLHGGRAQFRDHQVRHNTVLSQFSQEYEFRPLRYQILLSSDIEGVDGYRMSIYRVNIPIERRAKYYFWNYYFVSMVLEALAFGKFVMPRNSENRILLIATLFLVVAAFKMSVANMLPISSQLTQIDAYSMATSTYLFALYVYACICVGWHKWSDRLITEHSDNQVAIVFVLTWLAYHGLFLVKAIQCLRIRTSKIDQYGEIDEKQKEFLQGHGVKFDRGKVKGNFETNFEETDLTQSINVLEIFKKKV